MASKRVGGTFSLLLDKQFQSPTYKNWALQSVVGEPKSVGPVVANHENDTCFGNGLVMGSTDCINYAGLVKTPEKLF